MSDKYIVSLGEKYTQEEIDRYLELISSMRMNGAFVLRRNDSVEFMDPREWTIRYWWGQYKEMRGLE